MPFRQTPRPAETAAQPAAQPLLELKEVEATFIQIFALVGEAIAGATHALLTGDREVAKALVAQDERVDQLVRHIADLAQRSLAQGLGTTDERYQLIAVLRMLPDLERNGDLAEHIARRAARGLGAEMSPRSRGLIERMGEVAATIWQATATAIDQKANSAAAIEDLDDELDALHVTLTAEVSSGSMALPVAI